MFNWLSKAEKKNLETIILECVKSRESVIEDANILDNEFSADKRRSGQLLDIIIVDYLEKIIQICQKILRDKSYRRKKAELYYEISILFKLCFTYMNMREHEKNMMWELRDI